MKEKDGKDPGYILSVCLNPVLQKTLILPHLYENEVNRSGEYYLDASGKGVNVSRVLQQMGVPVVHLTHVGGMFTELFLSCCNADHLDLHTRDSGSEIRFCYTLLNRAKGTTTEIVEEAQPVGKGTEEAIITLYHQLLAGAVLVVISGTKAAGYTDSLYPGMVRAAREESKKVILDLKGRDLENCLPFGPDIIKPNFAEFIATFFEGLTVRESEAGDSFLPRVKEKMLALFQRYGVSTVLTRGRYPTILYNGEDITLVEPKSCRFPVNTIGCGDAFTAGLAAEYFGGHGLKQAVRLGHHCAYKNALSLRPGDITGKF